MAVTCGQGLRLSARSDSTWLPLQVAALCMGCCGGVGRVAFSQVECLRCHIDFWQHLAVLAHVPGRVCTLHLANHLNACLLLLQCLLR